MSLKLKSMCVLVALSVSISAQAEGYFGVKAGKMMIDLSGYDDPLNVGVVLGTHQAGWGFEGEFTHTVSGGEHRIPTHNEDIDFTTLAGYAAFRSESAVYLKTKLGAVFNVDDIGDSNLRASYGIGLGFRLGGGSMLEIEYTTMDEENFMSVGINF